MTNSKQIASDELEHDNLRHDLYSLMFSNFADRGKKWQWDIANDAAAFIQNYTTNRIIEEHRIYSIDSLMNYFSITPQDATKNYGMWVDARRKDRLKELNFGRKS